MRSASAELWVDATPKRIGTSASTTSPASKCAYRDSLVPGCRGSQGPKNRDMRICWPGMWWKRKYRSASAWRRPTIRQMQSASHDWKKKWLSCDGSSAKSKISWRDFGDSLNRCHRRDAERPEYLMTSLCYQRPGG